MSGEKTFYQNVISIAIPVTLQSIIMASLGMIDQLMVGQVGDTAIATVGMSTKLYAIVAVVLASLATGVSIYTAQFWGKKDTANIARLLGFALAIGSVFTLLFSLLVIFFPERCLQIFTNDPKVLEEGSIYPMIIAFSYFPTMLTMIYSAVARSTTHVKLPMYVSMATAVLNIGLNYLLIFGKMGFPEYGLKGAAIATVAARIFEMVFLISYMYVRKYPGAVGLHRMMGIQMPLVKRFLSTSIPLFLTELLWVLGETGYAVVYGRMGTEEMTAMTISFPLQGLSIGLLTGLASAAGVMVGNKLGADQMDEAMDYAHKFIRLGIVSTIVLGGLIAASSSLYVSAYNVTEDVSRVSIWIILMFSLFFWVKVSNMIIAGGILNSGGDSKFVFVMESLATWVVGVPSAFIAAFVLDLPIYWVYFILSMEEVVRLMVGFGRIRSRKWVRNLVHDVSAQA
ncbi:MATE family efflux transporter [Marinicrinis sediminis]|uniref:Probable multidrug resistance protein NorM n=1 Tax=Marinicrinis sediminis TaxID=1652465 RepID=A0ABW5R9W7_9BACL